MSNASNKINQINYLDALFSRGGRYTPDELADKLSMNDELKGGTSVKTVYRLLKEMKEKFKAPLVVDENNKRYYSSDQTVMLPSYVARAENVHALEIVSNLLTTIESTPIYEDAKKVFDELSIINPKPYTPDVKSPSRVIFLGAPAADIKDSVYNSILNAMEINHHIIIEYDLPTQKVVIKRAVQPFQLIYDDGIWDLWCYDCKNKRRQQYNLSRILSVEINPEPFALPLDYDYRYTTPGTFGCYRDQIGMARYKLFFRKSSYAATYAKDRVWGNNQEIEEREDGTVIAFDNNQFPLILRWILGWGKDVKPLEPESLVKEWKSEIEKLYKEIQEE